MEEDSLTSDLTLFPFQLTPEQAQQLNSLTAEQWLMHCQNVRNNHPWTEPAIDAFLSLPIDKIVEVFCDTIRHLVASSSPPIDPPTPDPTPSSSSTPPPLPTFSTSSPLPQCPLSFSEDQLRRFSKFSDDQFRELACNLKKNQKKWYPDAKAFLKLPLDIVAAALRQEVLSLCPPQ